MSNKIKKEQLSDACRAHDNAADRGELFPSILSKRGVDARDAVYVAEQRALRMILEMRGDPVPGLLAPMPIQLTAEEDKLLMKLATAWLDGLVVGMKVKEAKKT